MEKIIEKLKNNWIYVVGAILIIVIMAITIGVAVANDDISNEPTKEEITKATTTDIQESETGESTTERIAETTTVPEEITTEEVTTEQPTTEVATTEPQNETKTAPEPTTEEITTKVEAEYNPYEVLSTEFEPVDTAWERTTDVEEAFKNSAGSVCKCEIYNSSLLNETLIAEIDDIGDKWIRGEATVDDFERYFKSNVCVAMYDWILKNQWEYEWLTMVNPGIEINEPLNHFTIKGDGRFFVERYEELKKEATEWSKTFVEEECGQEWDGTIWFETDNCKTHFSNVSEMFVSVNDDYRYGGRGNGDRQYAYIRTYYDRSKDVTHIYLAAAYMCSGAEQYTEFVGTYDESISDKYTYRRVEYNGDFDPWEGFEPIS